MNIEALILAASKQGASDLHLEPSLPPAVRVRGQLQIKGPPLDANELSQAARHYVTDTHWAEFLERGSYDLSRTIQGVRCRINILRSARGVGFAIRLFSAFEATLKRLNLHPDLRSFVGHTHGLILISGANGSGKSSTLAALIQEINLSDARHIVTVESPIEFRFRPRQSYIRQREVGRDTPTFQQALIDALREDPDVIMVGEMREPETMRLTLNAAETGHLVLATVHSANTIEALQRIVAAFPSDIQNAIRSQLADSLIGVIAQRLRFRDSIKLRVPECEILRSNHAVQAHLRSGDLFKIKSALEMGAEHGMWTFDRYQRWLNQRKEFYTSDQAKREQVTDKDESTPTLPLPPARATNPRQKTPSKANEPSPQKTGGPIEIEPGLGELGRILRPGAD